MPLQNNRKLRKLQEQLQCTDSASQCSWKLKRRRNLIVMICYTLSEWLYYSDLNVRQFSQQTGRRTGVSDWRDWTVDRTSFFCVRGTSFHIHFPLLSFFLCFIILFQSCCSHAQVFGKTLMHEFSIFYSPTEWNLLRLSLGTNTLLWCNACYKITKL